MASDGRMKFAGPKMRRHITEDTAAITAGSLLPSADFSCSMRITIKRAVREKSMPSVLNVIREPISAPMTESNTQLNQDKQGIKYL